MLHNPTGISFEVNMVKVARINRKTNKFRGPQFTSELYRLSDRRLSAKFSANFCVVSAAYPPWSLISVL
jgi:hypothetical protein